MSSTDPEPVDAGGPPADLPLGEDDTPGAAQIPAPEPPAPADEEPRDGGGFDLSLVERVEGLDTPEEVAVDAEEAQWAEAMASAVDAGPPPEDVLRAFDVPDLDEAGSVPDEPADTGAH